MNNIYPNYSTVTIPLHEYEELKKNNDAALALLRSDDGVIYLELYNNRVKYHSKKGFDDEMIDRINGEISYSKRIKKALNDVSKMSIFGFLKFKHSYGHTSY